MKCLLKRFSLIPLVAIWSVSALAGTPREVTLAECLELSARNDPYIKNARLDIHAALEQKSEAMWEYFPSVKAGAVGFHALNPLVKITPQMVLGTSDAARELNEKIVTYAYDNGLKPYFATLGSGYGASVVAIQPIYAGGRIVSGNALASLGAEAARLQSGVKERQTRLEVERKYWTVVALQEKARTLDRMKRLLDTLSKDASAAVAAGVMEESALLQVKLKISEFNSGKIRLKSGLKLAKMDLFNAIGLEYTYLGIDDFVLTDSICHLKSPQHYYVDEGELPEFDESRLLAMQVKSKTLEKRMAVGEYLPQLGIGASAGYTDVLQSSSGTFNTMAFVSLQIPLTDIGKAVSRARRYDLQVQKASNEKEYLDAQLLLQFRQLQLEMDSLWEQMKVAEDAVTVAADSESRLRSNCIAGLSTMSDLLQAEVELRSCEENLIDRKMDYQMAVNAYLDRCGKIL